MAGPRMRRWTDLSVNFVRPASDGGFWKARYVRRCSAYAVVYLSSQSGCRQACQMCHLTATGPTTERGATVEDYLAQDDVVLAHLDRMEAVHGRPGLINVNLMAWGELLANQHFLSGWHALAEALEERAGRCGMGLQLNARPSCRPAWIRASFPAALATARGGARRVAGGVTGAHGG